MTTERALETRFRQAVRSQLGGHTLKIPPVVEAGVPDRLVMHPGNRCPSCHRDPLELVELKTDTGSLEPIQRAWHKRAARIGHEVTVLSGRAEIEEWVARNTS